MEIAKKLKAILTKLKMFFKYNESENNLKHKATATKVERVKSIDVLRGLAIALMIAVDNQGNAQRFYPQMRHAVWDGITFADFAFPIFVFIAGLVIPYAINKRISKRVPVYKFIGYICSRSIGLFLTGLFLNGFPVYDLSSIRIMGVMQRISLAYFVVSIVTLVLMYLIKNKKYQSLGYVLNYTIAFSIVLFYYWLFKGNFSQNGNLAQLIDLKYLKPQHMYTPTWEPEGLLGSISTCASALFGSAMGLVLMDNRFKKYSKVLGLILVGVITLELARKFNGLFPYNKNLWSSSFVLLTSGIGFILGSVLYFIIDVLQYNYLFKPFVALGSNPFFVYVSAELIRKTLWMIPITDGTTNIKINLNVWITTNYIAPWAGTKLDSFYFAICYVVVWMFIMIHSYDRKELKLKITNTYKATGAKDL